MKKRKLLAGLLATTLLAAQTLPTVAVEEVALGSYRYIGAREAQAAQTASLQVRGLCLTEESDEPVEVSLLAGAEFGIYVQDAQGSMRPWANPLFPAEPMRVLSGDQPVRFALPAGQQFYIHQEQAPAGYRTMDEAFLPVEADGQISVVNAMPGEVRILAGDTSGAALEGAAFRLTAPDGSVQEGVTDAQGQLTFAGLTAGLYAVEETQTPQSAAAPLQAVQNVQVSDATRTRVAFTHPQKGRLSVQALVREALEDGETAQRPIPGLTIELRGPEGALTLETDEDGYAQSALEQGTYRLTVDAQQLSGYTLSLYETDAVVVDEQETSVEILATRQGGRVVFDVRAGEGVGAQVSLQGEEQTFGPYDIEDGRVVTELLPAGSYGLSVSDADEGWLPAERVRVDDDEMPLAQAQVTVQDARAAQVELELLPVYTHTFTLMGTQAQPDGQETRTALPGVALAVLDTEGNAVIDAATGAAMTVMTDEQAQVTLTLPQGAYILYPDEEQEAIAQYATGGLYVELPAADDVLALPWARTRIVVSATDEEGARLSGAVYLLTDAAGAVRELSAGDTGRAVSELLSPGDYELTCQKAPGGYAASLPQRLTVEPGPALQVHMTHKELGGLSVSVRRRALGETGEEAYTPIPGASLALYALKDGGDPQQKTDFAAYPAEAPVTYTADESGAISLRLPAGTYRLVLKDGGSVSCGDGSECAITFTVVDGERREASLDIGVGAGGVEATLWGEWTDEQIAQSAYVLIADLDGDGVADEGGEQTPLEAWRAGVYGALGLAPGSYVLRQTLSPAGYGRADDLPVQVYGGALTRVDVRMLANALLRVSKVGITFDSDMQMFSVPLGAAYGVYTRTADGAYLPYPETDDQAVIYANATAAQTGAGAKSEISLPAREQGAAYYLREVPGSAADGYVADSAYHEILLYPGEASTATIASTSDKGFFTVRLTDAQTGAPLAGGAFALYALADADANVQPGQEPALRFTCEDGSFTNPVALPVGPYLLVQTAAPTGYMLDARVSATQIPLEITSYVATGDSIALVAVQNAKAMPAQIGGEMEALLTTADGRADLTLRELFGAENAVPVQGAGVQINGTDALDMEAVRILPAVSADGRALGARVAYRLENGGWQWADVRTADLSLGEATVSLADVAGVVTAVRILYIDWSTGAEEMPAGFAAEGVNVTAALVCGQDAQIQMSAQRLGDYTFYDERGENARTGSLTAQARSEMTTGAATQESAQRAREQAQAPAGEVAGAVFDDADGDGWMRPLDQHGLQGVQVTLLKENGEAFSKTVTDATGGYRFEDVPAGSYRVQIGLPAGWRFTQARSGLGAGARMNEQGLSDAFEIGEDGAFACVNVGVLLGAAVKGMAFEDINADGVLDAAEPALPGVPVTLQDAAGETLARTTTDETGAFYLDELFPGSYSLLFEAPHGYAAIAGEGLTASDDGAASQTDDVVLAAGEVSRPFAAGFLRVGEISGRAFIDEDGDGVHTGGDRALAGVNVKLMRDVDGQSVETAATATDSRGEYRFERVRQGKYRVLFELPESYVFTRYAPDEARGSDVYGAVSASGATQAFMLEEGEICADVDAGATLPAALTVLCWQDTAYDGVMSSTESGLAGVHLTLMRLEDGARTQTLAMETDANGRAVFEAVSPGAYVLLYALPDAWRTTKNVQREGAVVSGVPMSGEAFGETEPFTLSMGQLDAKVHIGAMISGSIRGAAYADADDNGLWDAGEAALSGVQVELLDDQGAVAASGATDAQGAYAFDGLAPGRYSVRFAAGEGNAFSGTGRTAARGCAQRTDGPVSATQTLHVTMGGSLSDVNAGVVALSTVSGRIFEDSDGDGVQGPGERMLPEVRVELFDAQTNRVVQETATASDGAFVFGGVRPGSYALRLTLPDGYVYSSLAGLESVKAEQGQTPAIQVRYGEDVEGLSFGALIMAKIAGLVWDDADYDGILSEGEGMIRDAAVELLDEQGNTLTSMATVRRGEFAFEGLMPGTYALRVTLPDGYVLTRGGADSALSAQGQRTDTTQPIAIAMGEQRTDVRFGALEPCTLSGAAWLDEDDDGRRGGRERAMPGVEVSLWRQEADGEAMIAKTTTDAEGCYAMDGIMPGTYLLKTALPEGYAYARRHESGRSTSAMPMRDALEAKSEPFALVSGKSEQMDVGVVGVGSISGIIWLDSEYDGRMSQDEAGIPGAKVELLDEQGEALRETATDENGRYAFTRVRTGAYSVRVRLPGGEIFTMTPEGGESRIAQQDASVAQTQPMALEMGAAIEGVNAGAIVPATIEGSAFIDRDEDGLRGEGEEALGGVLVELLTGGTVVASRSTDEQGAFVFDTLRPGSYRLRVALPDGYLFGREVALSLQHADDAQGESEGLQVDMGCSIDGLAYPVIPGVSVSGCAWEDLDVGGVREAHEPVLAGTQVELLKKVDGGWQSGGSVTVDGEGAYAFERLRPGTYAVRFTLPGGYLFTENATYAPESNSDVFVVPGQTGTTPEMTLVMGERAEHVDVGGIQPGALGDTVWLDENGNGLQDYAEPFVEGVTLELYAASQDGSLTLVETAVSDAYGRYKMRELRPGRYVLRVILPMGRTFTRNVEGLPEIDSDIVETFDGYGQTAVFVLESGRTLLNVDVGLM